MLLVHAVWSAQGLLFWAETDTPIGAAGTAATAAQAAAGQHPFACPLPELLEMVRRLPFASACPRPPWPMAESSQAITGLAELMLPTLDGAPLASSPLLGLPWEAPDTCAEPGAAASASQGLQLLRWRIPAVEVSPGMAIDILSRCPLAGRRPLVKGVHAADDLRFWAGLLEFAASLAAGGQFFPALAAAAPVWHPMVVGNALQELAALAKRMPAACRAATSGDRPGADAQPASEVAYTFVSLMVDHLVRFGYTGNQASTALKGLRDAGDLAGATPHDLWLRDLFRSPEGLEPTQTLSRDIGRWHAPLAMGLCAPYRLVLRLEEPEAGQKSARGRAPEWHVTYLLHPNDDPSLLVESGDLAEHASMLSRPGVSPAQYLLAALGLAGQVCDGVRGSLSTASPEGFDLDDAGTHTFLSEAAPALESLGFGLMLPGWWTDRRSRLKLAAMARLRPNESRKAISSGFGMGDVTEFDWAVAIGEEEATLEELLALGRAKSPLVRFRGQWVEVDQNQLRTALDLLQSPGGTASLRDLLRMAAGSGETGRGGLPVSGVVAEGAFKEIMARLSDPTKLEGLATPEGFAATLRPYQTRGFSWLSFMRGLGLGCCLADDMGLGKTVQALALILHEWQVGESRPNERKPVLLVCPTSVLTNWQREATRFASALPVVVHHGNRRLKGQAFANEVRGAALVLTSYALLHRDASAIASLEWSAVVLDEAQNIKNADAKVSRAARAIPAGYRVALTGTPVENHVGELRSIMEFLNPGLLGSADSFKKRFFVPIQTQGDAAKADELKRLTAPFILRRLKSDKSVISDLPDKDENAVYCNLTKEQASLYLSVAAELNDDSLDDEAVTDIERRGVALAVLTRLKQVCNHPAQLLADGSALPGRSGKLARLEEMLEEMLNAGERALVFTQFAEMGGMLRRHLQDNFGCEVLFLHGGVPRKDRDRMVDRFQSSLAAPPIFILSLKAGGTGLNLTGASHVFHYDRWWNPAVENQATDRAYRIGQTQRVQVHKFVCAGTLEERIHDLLERKQALAEAIIGSGEAWLSGLSTAELRGIVALGADAIAE